MWTSEKYFTSRVFYQGRREFRGFYLLCGPCVGKNRSVKTIFSSHLALFTAGGSHLCVCCAKICTLVCGMLHPWCRNKIPAVTGADGPRKTFTSVPKQTIWDAKWVPAHCWGVSQSLLPPAAVPPPAPSIGCCRLCKRSLSEALTGIVHVASTCTFPKPFQLLILSPFQSEMSSWWDDWERWGPANVSSEGMPC